MGQTDTVTKTVSVGEQTNNDATQGSIWIEDETLHWVNGNTEYWIRGDPNKIAEAGLASDLLDATSSAVSFQSSFSETPYVFATTQTTSGSQNPSQAHTWSVDKSGFTTQHCEYEAPDGCDTHSAETNGWSAINPSKIRDIAGMDAGTVSIQDSNTVSVSYNKNFDNTPIIFTQVQTKMETIILGHQGLEIEILTDSIYVSVNKRAQMDVTLILRKLYLGGLLILLLLIKEMHSTGVQPHKKIQIGIQLVFTEL